MSAIPAAATRFLNFCVPPEKANSGFRGLMIGGSLGRTDRMGPRRSASLDWNTAMRRLCWPSTTSSYTTSALMSPAWGRAASMFSILTTRAGRSSVAAPAAGRPVRGKTGGRVVVVVAGSVDDEDAAFLLPPDEQAAATSTKARATAATERRRREITVP